MPTERDYLSFGVIEAEKKVIANAVEVNERRDQRRGAVPSPANKNFEQGKKLVITQPAEACP